MQLVTDGEYRRAWWHFDFLEGLGGVEGYEAEQGIQFAGVQTKARGVKVTGKLHFKDHPFVEHFKFVKDHTKVTPKMTIPAPSVLHFRGGRKGISKDVYPDLDAFFDDLAKTYKDAVAAFYKAGCRYLQFDDTVWAYLCSQKELDLAKQRGDDPTRLPEIYAKVINEAIKDRPSDMAITTHVCRGNFRSTWISEGGYEPVAETLFGKVELRRLFPRIRHRAGRRLRAAALRAEGQQADRARPGHLEVRHAGEEGRHQEAHQGGDEIRRARPALPLAAVRLRLDRGRQCADRGGPVGQDEDDRGPVEGSVGLRPHRALPAHALRPG